jgi:6,7-dimethyl-8-ribityllumazine synthase
VSEWNSEITTALMKGAFQTLLKLGAREENIHVHWVPGSFELTYGAKLLAESGKVDAVICLGCVIQGDTPHFTYVCQGVTQGITQLNLQYKLPFIYGLLTTLNLEQATDRAGGKLGNKGDEAAVTAVKMVHLQKKLK